MSWPTPNAKPKGKDDKDARLKVGVAESSGDVAEDGQQTDMAVNSGDVADARPKINAA